MDEEIRAAAAEAPEERAVPQQSIDFECDRAEFHRRVNELAKDDLVLRRVTKPPEKWSEERAKLIAEVEGEIARMGTERNNALKQIKHFQAVRRELFRSLKSKRSWRTNLLRRKYRPKSTMDKMKAARMRWIHKHVERVMIVEKKKDFRRRIREAIKQI